MQPSRGQKVKLKVIVNENVKIVFVKSGSIYISRWHYW